MQKRACRAALATVVEEAANALAFALPLGLSLALAAALAVSLAVSLLGLDGRLDHLAIV